LVISFRKLYLHLSNLKNQKKKSNKRKTIFMADVKATTAASSAPSNKGGNTFLFNFLVVVGCIALAWVIWQFVLGSPKNFADGIERKVPNSLSGTMYHGGILVPFLIGSALTLFVFFFERLITVFKSRGRMSNSEFITSIKRQLDAGNVDAAMQICDKQAGSVGNVMKEGLKKYKAMSNASGMTQDQKIAVIQKQVEEATALELPMLEKNLVFLSTIASVATLLGLLGTVFGMIKAFRAMGQAGAPDANALATGISEALVNTALGIGTSFFAIIFYNFFTTIIDQVTYGIDESGFTLTQSFKANYPG
jgi:biopolymer transport protein ExbB